MFEANVGKSKKRKKSREPKRSKRRKACDSSSQNTGAIVVSDADHSSCLKALREIEWTVCQNTSRRNVIRAAEKKTPRNSRGRAYCQSFIFGPNMKDPAGSLSWWTEKYPQQYKLFCQLANKYLPDNFHFSHITVNKNLRCKRHTDGGNAGPSYITGFGDYTGGELLIEPRGGGKAKSFDLWKKFVSFNGAEQPHETADFAGERYTAVFYTSTMSNTRKSKKTIRGAMKSSKMSMKLQEVALKLRRSATGKKK